jgi:hypothetical protein
LRTYLVLVAQGLRPGFVIDGYGTTDVVPDGCW